MAHKSKTKYKSLSITKFGWKRVCNCVKRFGWVLYDGVEHTTNTTTDYYDRGGNFVKSETKSKVRMHLYFKRNADWFTNLPAIFLFELIFNIVFMARRIVGFFLPFSGIVMIGTVLLGGGQAAALTEGEVPVMMIIVGVFLAWLGLILLEEIISFIAGKILQIKQ